MIFSLGRMKYHFFFRVVTTKFGIDWSPPYFEQDLHILIWDCRDNKLCIPYYFYDCSYILLLELSMVLYLHSYYKYNISYDLIFVGTLNGCVFFYAWNYLYLCTIFSLTVAWMALTYWMLTMKLVWLIESLFWWIAMLTGLDCQKPLLLLMTVFLILSHAGPPLP